MRRTLCILLGLVALGAVAEAGKLSDALSELPKVTAEDVANALKELHASILEHAKEAAENIAEKRPKGVVANLINGSKRRLQTVGDGENFQGFMRSFYGDDWQSMVPESWANPSFDWAKLGDFEYSSNLADFLANIDLHNMTKIKSAADLAQAAAAIEESFCKPETFTPGEKVPASCDGPTVSIKLVPKECVLEAETKQVVCDPAKLVLTKTPGSCTHKYKSASEWTGKECKLSGGVGFYKETTVGGGNKEIPMVDLSIEYEP